MFDKDVRGPFGDTFARLERWVVNPATRTCSTTVISTDWTEFPRHRGALTGKPYRYGYCASPSLEPTWPTLKFDLKTGERSVFQHGPGRSAGEPVFVPRHGSDPVDGEDDGWLVTLVHDVPAGTAELVVLDAQDFSRPEVARVLLPQRIPYGFHGNWVSDRSVPPPA
jgi:carotenoid cleavage dioxygenase